MKKVMVFGTFDILHPGHLYLFEQAKHYGDYLIVVVGRDATVTKVKGKHALHNKDERLAKVKLEKIVDEAVLGNIDDQYKIIEEYRPDFICLGYDQKSFIAKGLPDELVKRGIDAKIMHIGPYKEDVYKSSKLRGRQN